MRRWIARMFYAELAGEVVGWLIYRTSMKTIRPIVPATGKRLR